jgi:acyl carrier protein
MDKDRLRNEIIQAIRTVQESSGRTYHNLGGNDPPIGALEGFDSLNALEVTVELETRLGIDMDGKNLLVNDEGTRALSVDEVVERIAGLQVAPARQETTDAA